MVPVTDLSTAFHEQSRGFWMDAVIQALIVEDEPIPRRRLKEILESIEGVPVVGECADVSAATDAWRQLRPNLIFLDVTLIASNGFDFLKQIPPDERPAVIIVTASAEHAREAFDYNAVDFLLKPFTRERLCDGLKKAGQHIRGKTQPAPKPIGREFITVKSDRRFVRVAFNDIQVILAEQRVCKILAGKETYVVSRPLRYIEAQLPEHFVRINRGTLINTHRIRMIHTKTHGDAIAELSTNQCHLVSRLYRARLAAALGQR